MSIISNKAKHFSKFLFAQMRIDSDKLVAAQYSYLNVLKVLNSLFINDSDLVGTLPSIRYTAIARKLSEELDLDYVNSNIIYASHCRWLKEQLKEESHGKNKLIDKIADSFYEQYCSDKASNNPFISYNLTEQEVKNGFLDAFKKTSGNRLWGYSTLLSTDFHTTSMRVAQVIDEAHNWKSKCKYEAQKKVSILASCIEIARNLVTHPITSRPQSSNKPSEQGLIVTTRICHNKSTDDKNSNTKSHSNTTANTVEEPLMSVKIEDESFALYDNDTKVYQTCHFCKKEVVSTKDAIDTLCRVSYDNNRYCIFCLRHRFNTRIKKDVLVFSFRSIIGYLYELNYHSGRTPSLYISQIQDLINEHVKLGEMNPLFIYDRESYLWFVDFRRVGDSPRKTPVDDVLKTICQIISAFNPHDNIKEFNSHKFFEKYKDAVMKFYSERYRPKGQRLLCPSLLSCASDTKEVIVSNTTYGASYTQKEQRKIDLMTFRDFVPQDLQPHHRR